MVSATAHHVATQVALALIAIRMAMFTKTILQLKKKNAAA